LVRSELARDSAKNLDDLARVTAIRAAPRLQDRDDLGGQQIDGVLHHAGQLLRLEPVLGAAGAGVQDGQAERLWAAASSHEFIFHALTWDEFRDPLGQNLAADVDVLLTRIGYKAEALVGVEPTNFTDWHVDSPFFSSLP